VRVRIAPRARKTMQAAGSSPAARSTTHGAVDEWESRPAFTRDTLRVRIPSALHDPASPNRQGSALLMRTGEGSSPSAGARSSRMSRSDYGLGHLIAHGVRPCGGVHGQCQTDHRQPPPQDHNFVDSGRGSTSSVGFLSFA
jgi:hypothetical protein